MVFCNYNKCVSYKLLVLLTIISAASGVTVGILVHTYAGKLSTRNTMYLLFGGQVFVSMLEALVVPLICSSIISAFGSMDVSISFKIGLLSVCFYIFSTLCAVTTAVLLVHWIQPGSREVQVVAATYHNERQLAVDIVMDVFRNMFPRNLVESTIYSVQTLVKEPVIAPNTTMPSEEEWEIVTKLNRNFNVLGTVTVAVIFGIVFASMDRMSSKSFLDVVDVLTVSVFQITKWVVWLSPIGIFCQTAAKVSNVDFQQLEGLGMYVMVVLVGFASQALVTLPLVYVSVTRRNPYRFIYNMSGAILTALVTSSSNATLPTTLQCLEENNMVDQRLTRFVLPLATAINKNGTAIFISVAIAFIAQLHKMKLYTEHLFILGVAAAIGSIMTSGTPFSGFFTLKMALVVVSLPGEEVSVIFTVEWFLDRLQTVVNVLGTSIAAGVVEHICSKELGKLRESDESVGLFRSSTGSSIWLKY